MGCPGVFKPSIRKGLLLLCIFGLVIFMMDPLNWSCPDPYAQLYNWVRRPSGWGLFGRVSFTCSPIGQDYEAGYCVCNDPFNVSFDADPHGIINCTIECDIRGIGQIQIDHKIPKQIWQIFKDNYADLESKI